MVKSQKPDIPASLKGIFDGVDSLNQDSTLLSDENSLSIVNDWIDTGSYALNAVLSGSLYKGVPAGRLTGFVGPSQSFKTVLINKIIGNAQRKGYFAAVWDTENALDAQTAINCGMDPARTKYYPVRSVEDTRNQIAKLLADIIAANDPDLKIIIAIDSLGNLSGAKEQADIEKGKDASDMGQKAKALRSMLRSLTYLTAKARVPLLFTNHIYENPTAMYPELIKKQSGGLGPLYIASILAQLSTRNEKIAENEDQASVAIAHSVSGATLSVMTVKNRFVPAFLKTEIYNNFRTGPDRWAGLSTMAVAFGVVKPEKEGGTTYVFNGEKIGRESVWAKNTTLWENSLLAALETTLKEQVCYSNATTAAPTPAEETAS